MSARNAGELLNPQHQIRRNFALPAHPLANCTLAPAHRLGDVALALATGSEEAPEIWHRATLAELKLSRQVARSRIARWAEHNSWPKNAGGVVTEPPKEDRNAWQYRTNPISYLLGITPRYTIRARPTQKAFCGDPMKPAES